jgi:hypothetical protein
MFFMKNKTGSKKNNLLIAALFPVKLIIFHFLEDIYQAIGGRIV